MEIRRIPQRALGIEPNPGTVWQFHSVIPAARSTHGIVTVLSRSTVVRWRIDTVSMLIPFNPGSRPPILVNPG